MAELKSILVSADYSAPSGSGAGSLYLKRKRAQQLADATPIVLLHGSTLPGSAVFDLQLDNLSWMDDLAVTGRSEEHTSELQSLMRISYAVFCLKKKHSTQQTMKTI